MTTRTSGFATSALWLSKVFLRIFRECRLIKLKIDTLRTTVLPLIRTKTYRFLFSSVLPLNDAHLQSAFPLQLCICIAFSFASSPLRQHRLAASHAVLLHRLIPYTPCLCIGLLLHTPRSARQALLIRLSLLALGFHFLT